MNIGDVFIFFHIFFHIFGDFFPWFEIHDCLLMADLEHYQNSAGHNIFCDLSLSLKRRCSTEAHDSCPARNSVK